MKYPQKIIAFFLTTMLIASSMGVASSAVYIARCTSYGENNICSNAGYASPSSSDSVCLPNLDQNKVCGIPSYLVRQVLSDVNSNCTANVAGVSANSSPTKQKVASIINDSQTQAYGNATSTTNTPTNKVVSKTTAVPEAAKASNPATKACTATNATTTASPTAAAAASQTNSCVVSDNSCPTLASSDVVLGRQSLLDCFTAFFKKCGIYFPNLNTGTPAQANTTTTTTPQSNTGAKPTTPVSPDNTSSAAGSSENSIGSNKANNLAFEQQVAALVNQERAANGLAPLTLSVKLSDVARVKSQDMHDKNYFSHTSPTYGSPFDMLHTFGITYRAAGENIAMGYATPDAVMTGWMNSPGHRANILNASYTQIGIGYVASGNYWTQEFIG